MSEASAPLLAEERIKAGYHVRGAFHFRLMGINFFRCRVAQVLVSQTHRDALGTSNSARSTDKTAQPRFASPR